MFVNVCISLYTDAFMQKEVYLHCLKHWSYASFA